MKSDYEKLEEWLEKMDSRLEKQGDRFDELNVTMTRNTESLVHHVKRTDLLEERVQAAENRVDNRLKPVEKFTFSAKIALKVLGALAVGFTGILGVLESLKALGLL